MTQAIPSSFVVPVLQIVAGVAVLQIFTRGQSQFPAYALKKISGLTDELFIAGKKVIFDSPVIAVSAGVAYLGQLCDQKFVVTHYPSWSLGTLGESPLKVALYVAGILMLRSALSNYLRRVVYQMDVAKKTHYNVKRIRKVMVRNIIPIAIGCAAAYYAGVPVKLAQTALFTAALIPVVKLLGNSFEYFISVEIVEAIFEKVHGWMK
jgi:hypothetical protein